MNILLAIPLSWLIIIVLVGSFSIGCGIGWLISKRKP
jgi:hypothetical protein